jgi:transcriptional regulator with XRE-family HTH domain
MKIDVPDRFLPLIEQFFRTIKLISRMDREIEKRRLTVRIAAKQLGVTAATLSRWQNGHNIPTSDRTLKAIEKFVKEKP